MRLVATYQSPFVSKQRDRELCEIVGRPPVYRFLYGRKRTLEFYVPEEDAVLIQHRIKTLASAPVSATLISS